MNKKALMLASVASMIDQFNMPNIQTLQSLGYQVDVVADFTNPGSITQERAEDLKSRLRDMNVRVFDIVIPRTLNLKSILIAYKEVKKLINAEHYSLIHCHSPIGGVICRQAARGARRSGSKVIYTAHGFHFYDGAPLRNWMVFYPIEKYYSRYTDVLITINKEDYARASKKFHAHKTIYVPGVGVDTEKFSPKQSGRNKIREELGLREFDIMLLSVGELNENKNHISVIKAISGIDNLTYVIVGKGAKEQELKKTASECGVNLLLSGYRMDVADFYNAADMYVLPSLREGLNVSLMEAMASGLAVVCGRIRGNTDLIVDKDVLFDPLNVKEIRGAITNAIVHKDTLGKENLEIIRAFDLENVQKEIAKIYQGVLSNA